MNKHGLARVLLLSAATLLAACSNSASKIGSTAKGERISALEATKVLEADKGLTDSKPVLPHSIVNFSWSQAGYDSEHAMPYAEVSAQPKVLWNVNIGAGSDSDFKLLAHPVIERGVVYTMDAQGLVSALNATTGEKKWDYDTTPKDSEDAAIGGGLAVDGGTLYATTGFGDVVAMEKITAQAFARRADGRG